MAQDVNQSIDRTLQILELFSLEKSEWGVTEIAEALNFYKSTVHNILTTLESRAFVHKDPSTGKYRLSIKFFELGSVVLHQMDLRSVAHPYVEELSKVFNETVHLGVRSDREVLSIEREESHQSLRPQIFVGKRAPLYCTAVGKAIMAFLPTGKVEDILRHQELKPFTKRTITDPVVMRRELEKIRNQGYAVDDMEHEEGVTCIAAPIRNRTGTVIASMSVSGPSYRLERIGLAEVAEKVMEYCEDISSQLGYRSSRVG